VRPCFNGRSSEDPPPIPDAGPHIAVPFGKYLLIKRLAVGGMAELFLAQDNPEDPLVVIKRILPYLGQEPEFVRMFLDEARIAAQLHHPNIVQVRELGKLEDSIFLAMEYVEGVDLRKILVREQKGGASVPYEVGARIVADVCAGLHYAHHCTGVDGRKMEIVHRDVSPQNVMVGFDGRVKLVDFGIARANAFMERSKPGVLKGKFLYLSPEQVLQEDLDHRSDLFALGTLLYEITTGRAPFGRPTPEAVIFAIRREEPQSPQLVRADYPPALAAIVTKCLAKDRNQRYQDASEIQADLEAFLAHTRPVGAAEVGEYVQLLFGDDEERTILNIPTLQGTSQATLIAPPVLARPPVRRQEIRPLPGNAPTPAASPVIAAPGASPGRAITPPVLASARPAMAPVSSSARSSTPPVSSPARPATPLVPSSARPDSSARNAGLRSALSEPPLPDASAAASPSPPPFAMPLDDDRPLSPQDATPLFTPRPKLDAAVTNPGSPLPAGLAIEDRDTGEVSLSITGVTESASAPGRGPPLAGEVSLVSAGRVIVPPPAPRRPTRFEQVAGAASPRVSDGFTGSFSPEPTGSATVALPKQRIALKLLLGALLALGLVAFGVWLGTHAGAGFTARLSGVASHRSAGAQALAAGPTSSANAAREVPSRSMDTSSSVAAAPSSEPGAGGSAPQSPDRPGPPSPDAPGRTGMQSPEAAGRTGMESPESAGTPQGALPAPSAATAQEAASPSSSSDTAPSAPPGTTPVVFHLGRRTTVIVAGHRVKSGVPLNITPGRLSYTVRCPGRRASERRVHVRSKSAKPLEISARCPGN
jgi:serine/threonine-protein kinase